VVIVVDFRRVEGQLLLNGGGHVAVAVAAAAAVVGRRLDVLLLQQILGLQREALLILPSQGVVVEGVEVGGGVLEVLLVGIVVQLLEHVGGGVLLAGGGEGGGEGRREVGRLEVRHPRGVGKIAQLCHRLRSGICEFSEVCRLMKVARSSEIFSRLRRAPAALYTVRRKLSGLLQDLPPAGPPVGDDTGASPPSPPPPAGGENQSQPAAVPRGG